MTNVSVTFNRADVIRRIEDATKKGQKELTKHALKDCTKYTKEDTGDLIQSGQDETKLDEGLLIWDTPYAKRQYYLDSTKTLINPNATFMWAHYAEKKHGKDWKKTLQKEITKGV